MLQRVHQKLGTAGFIVALIALVAALGGGAYAAQQVKLSPTQKKEVKKIAQTEAKKLATSGPIGPGGPKGEPGFNGTNGSNGTDGESVEAETVGKGAKCAEGGTVFKVGGAEKGKACNGVEGNPWTAGGTLPPGETETGTWSVSQFYLPEFLSWPVAISFPIPLAGTANPVYLNAEETANEAETGGCKWEQDNPVATPEAPEGTLCVFEENAEKVHASGFSFFSTPGDPEGGGTAGPTGIYAWFSVEGEPAQKATLNLSGAWAVTAGPSGP